MMFQYVADLMPQWTSSGLQFSASIAIRPDHKVRTFNHRCLTSTKNLPNTKVSTRQPCWSKTDFDVKVALKVIHFAINHRQTRGSISPCNIAGLISDVSEEVATQIAKNCRRRQPHC